MASLLHVVDTDSLQKDPNLKFDPQNPSAHLNKDHPNFQQLKEGLDPEQIEILENTTQVAGFDVEEDNYDDTVEVIDPETGEEIDIEDLEYTLTELGFVDPEKIRTLTLEAFYSFKLESVLSTIGDVKSEIDLIHDRLLKEGYVSSTIANNLNDAMAGQLYSNIAMESFTKLPTKTNYKLVLEEANNAQAALAAGGAIVGAALLYKLVKWFLNSWNKNSVASGSIKGNIQNIQQRRERIKNSDDVIAKANSAMQSAIDKLKRSGDLNNEMKEFLNHLNSLPSAQDKDQALKNMADLEKGTATSYLKPFYSNIWLSLSTKQQVNVGSGKMIVNKQFFTEIANAIGACKELQNVINNQVETIRNTGADKAIQDKSSEYKTALEQFKKLGKVVGYIGDQPTLHEYSNGIVEHINANVVKPLGDSFIIKEVPDLQALEVIDPNAWANANDDYLNDINEFQKRIQDLLGREEVKSWTGAIKQQGQADVINQGGAVQRDSRISEYEKLTQAFRASMGIMRVVLAIRNNIGAGLSALNKASAVTYRD